MIVVSDKHRLRTNGADRVLLGWEATESEQRIGFIQSTGQSPEPRLILGKQEHPHYLTIAPTSAGKGRCVLIPNLLTYKGTVVVLDVKGELYQVTARRRREMGIPEVKLDPFHVVDDRTDGLNPLDILDLERADLETDVQSLASMLAEACGFSKDPFWDLSASSLHSGIMAYLGANAPREQRNLNQLRNMLHGDDTVYNLAALLDACKDINRMAYQEIAAFLQQAEQNTRPGVLSTAASYVKTFASQRVANSLQSTTFSLADFVAGKPMSIYIIVPPDRMQSHKQLLRLWIGTLLKAVFSRRSAPAVATLMMLDECGQLGSFRLLQDAITIGRGYGLNVWSVWQDRTQIEQSFPESWKTLVNNCALQVFGIGTPWLADQWADLLDRSPDELLQLADTDQFLLRPHLGIKRCRRLDYLADELFAGLYDDNRFYANRPKRQHEGTLPR